MFSGIVVGRASVLSRRRVASGVIMAVRHSRLRQLRRGDSVAVNGCCLTVISRQTDQVFLQIIPETQKTTTLGRLIKGQQVNIELPLRLNDFVSGHLVTGHVDAVGRVTKFVPAKNRQGTTLTVTYPAQFRFWLVNKGSVTVDGIALTVVKVTAKYFTVALTDVTLETTTSREYRVSGLVNLEFDLLAKYVAQISKKK